MWTGKGEHNLVDIAVHGTQCIVLSWETTDNESREMSLVMVESEALTHELQKVRVKHLWKLHLVNMFLHMDNLMLFQLGQENRVRVVFECDQEIKLNLMTSDSFPVALQTRPFFFRPGLIAIDFSPRTQTQEV